MTSLRWVLRLGRSGRGRLGLAILLGALASGAAVGLTATSAWLISRASQRPPVLHLMVAIVAVRAFGLARGVLRYGERLTGHDASFRTLGDLRVATVERLEQVLPIRTTAEQGPLTSSELLSRFVDDTDSLQDLWVRVVLPYTASTLVGVGSVALVTVLAPAAGLALAGTLLVAALLAPIVSARAARGADARLAPLRAEYQAGVLDLLDGATELAVYGALPTRLAELERRDELMRRSEARSAVATGYGAAIATLAAGAAMWAGLWFGAGAVDARTLGAVSLAVVVLVPLAVHEVFAGLAPAAHQLPSLASAAARVQHVFQQPAAVQEPDTPQQPPAAPFGLRARGLRARWNPDGPDVLFGLDLDIAPGSQTLIVGPSGAGKSTLAAVLLRLLDPTDGAIELIGGDGATLLHQMAGDDVRRIIGWCAQDAYIFDSTIEANLRLARPDATAEQLIDALRRAGLAHWVGTLPKGLDTMVGEHGSHLSGGQRQRLALARTLLADRPIVIFDEPTEHLDDATAAQLATDIVNATRGATVVVVTHRPELFPIATTTLLLERGVLRTHHFPATQAATP
ncbi:MAG: thiol reductant ABC exporter subunit CydC [Actinomycetota bacterium]|nr:thiol reductant ABC exporter subunit CydC [Actinomycetota bacterium]